MWGIVAVHCGGLKMDCRYRHHEESPKTWSNEKQTNDVIQQPTTIEKQDTVV